jgi:hypothetical protein
MKSKKKKSLFDVPLDSEEGMMISAIAQTLAEDFKENAPMLFGDNSVPEMMISIKKFWNEGIIEVDFNQDKDGFNVSFNLGAAIEYMLKENA